MKAQCLDTVLIISELKNIRVCYLLPCSDEINQDKYLPLRYMGGMTLEF